MRLNPVCCRALAGWLVCATTSAFVMGTQAIAEGKEPVELSGRQIIDGMYKVYAGCKTYHDSGVVKTVFLKRSGKRTVEKHFATAFIRPGQFRFELIVGSQRRPRRYIIWSNGTDVLTWRDVEPGINKAESLSFAVAFVAGVSDGSSKNIPSLLLADMEFPQPLIDITRAKRVEDIKCGNSECFRVQGMIADTPITLWIDKELYVIRQIEVRREFDNFKTESTTLYQPHINGVITDEMLRFDPPTGK